eukprot:TRINITY_DN4091_c0_g1_i1.p1 TRINITY_DN4091_c0_g1~~TRINITY_DN4091_c0_g1_i1.p1  ORF type:complete len:158 (-),score=45.81 TRINITY_DN4091_c0_g1_i1:166-639(-)
MNNLFGRDNLSYYGIPAAWALATTLNLTGVVLLGKYYNNADPRNQWGKVATDNVSTAEKRAVASRWHNASSNGYEGFPLFASAVLLGNWARLGGNFMNYFTAGYFAVRGVYTYLYVTTPSDASEAHANARTVVWLTGTGLCSYVLVRAANVLKDRLL